MKRGRLIGAAIAFVLTFASVSGQATALTSVNLHVPASHGYRFGLYVTARPSRTVASAGLVRNFGGDSAAAAFYAKRRAGGFTGGRMHADFGPYGTTSAKFVKKKTHRSSTEIGSSGCKIVESRKVGVFRGHIDFEGEAGFAAVHASKARGAIFKFKVSRACHVHPRVEVPELRTPMERYEARNEPRPKPSYELGTCGADPSTYFVAAREDGDAYFETGSSERVDGIHINRFAWGTGPQSGFKLGEQATQAMVRPGMAPFDGTGRFADRRLRGNLEVDLPGGADTSLTPGKGFLKPAEKVRKDLPCFPYTGD